MISLLTSRRNNRSNFCYYRGCTRIPLISITFSTVEFDSEFSIFNHVQRPRYRPTFDKIHFFDFDRVVEKFRWGVNEHHNVDIVSQCDNCRYHSNCNFRIVDCRFFISGGDRLSRTKCYDHFDDRDGRPARANSPNYIDTMDEGTEERPKSYSPTDGDRTSGAEAKNQKLYRILPRKTIPTIVKLFLRTTTGHRVSIFAPGEFWRSLLQKLPNFLQVRPSVLRVVDEPFKPCRPHYLVSFPLGTNHQKGISLLCQRTAYFNSRNGGETGNVLIFCPATLLIRFDHSRGGYIWGISTFHHRLVRSHLDH